MVGYRVAVCENMMFSGEFQRVLAKHSKNFSLVNALSIGIDQMQRNFEPMQIETWGRFFGVRPHKSKIDIHYVQTNRLRRLFEPGVLEF